MDTKDLAYKVGQKIDTKIEMIREDTSLIIEALINIRASVDELRMLKILIEDIKKL